MWFTRQGGKIKDRNGAKNKQTNIINFCFKKFVSVSESLLESVCRMSLLYFNILINLSTSSHWFLTLVLFSSFRKILNKTKGVEEVYNDQLEELTLNKTKQSLARQSSTHSWVRFCLHWTDSFPLQLSSAGIVYSVVWRQEITSLP